MRRRRNKKRKPRRETGSTENSPDRGSSPTVLNIVTAAGALIAAFSATFGTWVSFQDHTVNREQVSQDKEAELDARYHAAIRQLSSTGSVTQRVGGVLTLTDIAKDSARLRPRVIVILCDHVKERAGTGRGGTSGRSGPPAPPQADIQRAITVLGHSPLTPDSDRVDLDGRILPRIDLHGTALTRADLRLTHFDGANFGRAVLTFADLRRASLRNADFTGADLSGADLRVAIMTGTDFTGAKLVAADLTGSPMPRAKLGGTDLTDARLSGNVLVQAALVRARLVRADLEGAQLTNASLTRADLTKANLTGARLMDADLSGADLTGADLNQAVLAGADLTGVKGLTLAQLRSARTITTDTKLPNGFRWSPSEGVRQS